MNELIYSIASSILTGGIVGFGIKKYFETKIVKSVEHSYKTKYDNFKKEIDKEIEKHKFKLKMIEFIYPKQLEALKELYKIKINIMPKYDYYGKDFEDALNEIVHSFDKNGEILSRYLSEYACLLPEKINTILEDSVELCEFGQFCLENDGIEVTTEGNDKARAFWDKINNAVKEFKMMLEIEA